MNKGFIYVLFIILIITIITGAFFWYEYRPTKIRRECANKISSITEKVKSAEANIETGFGDDLRYVYEHCLHQKGLSE